MLPASRASGQEFCFDAAALYAASDGPVIVFAADLDGDNDADLAVANAASDNISVLKNNGDGTFAAAVNYTTGDGPQSVIAAGRRGVYVSVEPAVAETRAHGAQHQGGSHAHRRFSNGDRRCLACRVSGTDQRTESDQLSGRPARWQRQPGHKPDNREVPHLERGDWRKPALD